MKYSFARAAGCLAAGLAASMFFAALAQAKGGGLQGGGNPCRADMQRLCASSIGNPQAARECAVAHRTEFSQECVAFRRARREELASLSPTARVRRACLQEYPLHHLRRWSEAAILSQCMAQKQQAAPH